jgi:hypothetical protein
MTRRSCMSALGMALLPAGKTGSSAFAQSRPAITISGFETSIVHVNARGNWVFVHLLTDSESKASVKHRTVPAMRPR